MGGTSDYQIGPVLPGQLLDNPGPQVSPFSAMCSAPFGQDSSGQHDQGQGGGSSNPGDSSKDLLHHHNAHNHPPIKRTELKRIKKIGEGEH